MKHLLFNLLILLLMLGCGSNSDENSKGDSDFIPPIITEAPEIILDPNSSTPLAALLKLETDEPTRVIARVERAGEGAITNSPDAR